MPACGQKAEQLDTWCTIAWTWLVGQLAFENLFFQYSKDSDYINQSFFLSFYIHVNLVFFLQFY